MAYTWKKHKFPFSDAFLEAFRWRDPQKPSEWIEDNFKLTTAYATQGDVKLFPWQIPIVNAITEYDTVIVIAPTQFGKSFIAEAISAYLIDNEPMNMMFCYHKRELVQDVFDERLKPMIKEIPVMAKYWSGNDEDLTKRRIKLSHLIIRVASAVTRTDIATFNAGFIYGAEFAKYPKKDFSQIKMLFGRQQASRMLGKKTKALLETSPEDDQDPSYTETHKAGVRFTRPHYPCPHCGRYQFLTDRQIKEIPNKKGIRDHDPARIEEERAAYYECKYCKKKITEEHRYDMRDKLIYAAVDDKKERTIEKIDKKGKIKNPIKGNRIVFQITRLVDDTWSFASCLSAYFEALNSPNPADLKTYRNEDHGDWVSTTSKRYEESYLVGKKLKYNQVSSTGENNFVPDGALVLLCGIDTQDTGFYVIVRGYGRNLESWLVRAEFVKCDMNESKFQNPAEVHEHLTTEMYRYPYKKRNGKTMDIYWTFIDRGGHRAEDVDYFVEHTPSAHAYIGSTSKQAPLIDRKDSGFYFGNTENLSKMVQKNIESSIWHLPKDIPDWYISQVLNQFTESYKDKRGHTKKRWISVDPDHARDCENMICGAVIECELREMLFDESTVRNIKAQENQPHPEEKALEVEEPDSDYFARRSRW